jgi:hypothetical protein
VQELDAKQKRWISLLENKLFLGQLHSSNHEESSKVRYANDFRHGTSWMPEQLVSWTMLFDFLHSSPELLGLGKSPKVDSNFWLLAIYFYQRYSKGACILTFPKNAT